MPKTELPQESTGLSETNPISKAKPQKKTLKYLPKINLGLDKTDKYLYNWFCSCGFSSSGRASPCQGEGSEFESRNPLHIIESTNVFSINFMAP